MDSRGTFGGDQRPELVNIAPLADNEQHVTHAAVPFEHLRESDRVGDPIPRPNRLEVLPLTASIKADRVRDIEVGGWWIRAWC